MNSQLITCGNAQPRKAMAKTVNTISLGVAIRFLRTQASGPLSLRGAGSASRKLVLTKGWLDVGILSLHQSHLGIEPVHQQRGEDAEGEIDDCPDEDDFDRLARLVKDRAADRNEIREADGNGQRRVLRQV